MVRHVMSRSQRRIEKKQALAISVLALAVSLVSFTLGVLVGRYTSPASEAVMQEVLIPEPPPLHPVLPKNASQSEPLKEEPPSSALTFYESLPKGEPSPLGTGINLPPQGAEGSETSPQPLQGAKNVAPPSLPKVPAKGVPHILQAASFASADDAKSLADRLGAMGFACRVETADLESKGHWYRVLVGPYPSKEAAETAASLLKAEAKLAALVRKR